MTSSHSCIHGLAAIRGSSLQPWQSHIPARKALEIDHQYHLRKQRRMDRGNIGNINQILGYRFNCKNKFNYYRWVKFLLLVYAVQTSLHKIEPGSKKVQLAHNYIEEVTFKHPKLLIFVQRLHLIWINY